MRGCHCNFSFKNWNNFQQVNQLVQTFQASSSRSAFSGENKSYKVNPWALPEESYSSGSSFFFWQWYVVQMLREAFHLTAKKTAAAEVTQESFTVSTHTNTLMHRYDTYNMRTHTFADIATHNFTFKTSHGDPHTHIHLSQSSLLVETHACNRHQPNTCRQ